VPLLADGVSLLKPGIQFRVHLLDPLQPKVVDVVSRRDGIDPPEAGMLEPARQDHVAVDPIAPRSQLRERHSDLEGDPCLFWQNPNRTNSANACANGIEDGTNAGILAGEVRCEVVSSARVLLVSIGERALAARAHPQAPRAPGVRLFLCARTCHGYPRRFWTAKKPA